MTKDDVIRFAREAGLLDSDFDVCDWEIHEFTTFAKLVAEHEREACAKTSFIYDLTPWKYDLGHLRIAQIVSIEIGKAIRARGQE